MLIPKWLQTPYDTPNAILLLPPPFHTGTPHMETGRVFCHPLSHALKHIIVAKNLERSRYSPPLHACRTIIPYGTIVVFLANGNTHGTVNICTYL